MSKRKDGQHRVENATEFKLEAVRLVKGGQSITVPAKVLGKPEQTLDNWVRRSEKGVFVGEGKDTARQLKKATVYFARE